MTDSNRAEKSLAMTSIRQKLLNRSNNTIDVDDIEKAELQKKQDYQTARDRVIWKSFSYYMAWDFAKADKEKRLVTWVASSEAVDSYGDIVRFSAMKDAFMEYMKFGNIREMHGPSAVWTVKDYELDEKSKTTTITSKIVDDNAWNKVIEGVYKWYSIWGRIIEAEPLVVKAIDENGNEYDVRTWWLDIIKIELIEISLVDRPACPEALIESYKSNWATQNWFVPEFVFVEKNLAKSDSKSDSLVKTILTNNTTNPMFEKVWNNVIALFKSEEDIDLEAMKWDETNAVLTKGQTYDLIKEMVSKSVSAAESIAKSEEEAGADNSADAWSEDNAGWSDEGSDKWKDNSQGWSDEWNAENKWSDEAAEKADIAEIISKAVEAAVTKTTETLTKSFETKISEVNEKIEKSNEANKFSEEAITKMFKNAWISVQKDSAEQKQVSVFKGIFG